MVARKKQPGDPLEAYRGVRKPVPPPQRPVPDRRRKIEDERLRRELDEERRRDR